MIKITGIASTKSNLKSIDKRITERVLLDIQNSYKRYQLNAFKAAPVLEGYLSSALVDENFTSIEVEDGSMTITQREGVEYMLIQEYGNPNGKDRFIRDAFLREINQLPKDIERGINEVVKSV